MAEQKIEQKLVIAGTLVEPGSTNIVFDVRGAFAAKLPNTAKVGITHLTIYAPTAEKFTNPFSQIQLHSGGQLLNTSHFRYPSKQQLFNAVIAIDPYLYGCNRENSILITPKTDLSLVLIMHDSHLSAAQIRIVARYRYLTSGEHTQYVWQEQFISTELKEFAQSHKIICSVGPERPVKNVMLETSHAPLSAELFSAAVTYAGRREEAYEQEIVYHQLDYAGANSNYYCFVLSAACREFVVELIFYNKSDIPNFEMPRVIYHKYTKLVYHDGTISTG